MGEIKRRSSQNNRLLRLVIERLREYELEEVVFICNKFKKRRNIPELNEEFLHVVLPADNLLKLRQQQSQSEK